VQVIYTDVALDPYNSDGHDGIVNEAGKCLYCNRDTLLEVVRASESETLVVWPVTMIGTGVLLPFRSAFEIVASELQEV
jgi:delta-aminolevulinic acid dehydratase/porphobilinogen synthase